MALSLKVKFFQTPSQTRKNRHFPKSKISTANNIFRSRLRLESVQNAVEQAKSIASNIAGNHKPYQKIPWFWSDQYNIKLQIAGISQNHDNHTIRGLPEEEKFSVFYQKDKRLIAVDAINNSKEFFIISVAFNFSSRPALGIYSFELAEI